MDFSFDNAATTRLSERALKAYIDTERNFFANPSSVHSEGIRAKNELERIRERMAELLDVKPECLFFTAGATESISAVFSSLLLIAPGAISMSRIEHDAVSSWIPALKEHGWDIERIKARGGVVTQESLDETLKDNTKFVAVMAVNNITGAVENIEELSTAVRAHEKKSGKRIFLFSDSVQALGKTDWNAERMGIDGASFSAHKINGPRGIGLLYLKNPSSFRPLAKGGGQERGKRGGTENLPAIAAFLAATEEWMIGREEKNSRIRALSDRLKSALADMGLKTITPQNSSPYIVSFISPLPSQVFTRMLSDRGMYVSAGSACSNNSKGESELILQAMGVRAQDAKNAIRVSFSNDTDEKSVEMLIKTIKELKDGR